MIRIGIHTGQNNTQAYRKAIEKVVALKLVGEFRHNNSNNRSQKLNGYKNYTEFSDIIEDCDAILFLNYSNSHFDALIKAVKSSKHIFLESIHNLDLMEARELMKLAVEANVIFKIGLKESCFACMQEIKSDFENPLLIESIITKKNNRKTQYNILDNEIVDIIFQCLNLMWCYSTHPAFMIFGKKPFFTALLLTSHLRPSPLRSFRRVMLYSRNTWNGQAIVFVS